MSCNECDGCGYCYEKAAAEQERMLEEEQEWKEQEWDNFCKRHQLSFGELHKDFLEPTLQDVNEEISIQFERDNPP